MQNIARGQPDTVRCTLEGLGLDSFSIGRPVLSVHRRHLKEEETRIHEDEVLGQKSHSEFVAELRTGA